ncbi:terminase small subunit [Microbulbifer flavimaris]|uniref:Terminase small subunit n=1 Tax=Microbulbifer flavimaris TaxID=1781068 RepID=A0ABX4HZK6_9GAMM|nr:MULTISPECIES: terminase small subunit [Microbulbifer]KUJ83424.1 hypothetical protein AVO43_06055 [Microbulbifer sp. ZGT114]PCO05580.1 terminase small subunit [Microbulbifer flavimaris]
MKKLTHKQTLFVEEYLIDLNATQAAIRAGYSSTTARQIAAENLSKPDIAEAINHGIAKRLQRTRTSADGVLQRLVEIDQLDIKDLFDEAGRIKPIHQWPDAWSRSISSFELKMPSEDDPHTASLKIRLPDKLKNLELIGRHSQVGAFREKSDSTVAGIEDLIDELTS